MKLIFNPDYVLKLESRRVIVLPRSPYLNSDITQSPFILHPIQALILSFFDGRDYKVVLQDISKLLKLDIDILDCFIKQKIMSRTNNHLHNRDKNINYVFPKNALIYVADEFVLREQKYSVKDIIEYYSFNEEMDYSIRHETPTDLVLVINNVCYTDCVYCYADRRQKVNNGISLQRLYEIIDEFASFGGREFLISGGEWIYYKGWDKLLKRVLTRNLSLFISTKVPLKEEDVKMLKEAGVDKIQVSLDSLLVDTLSSILNVSTSYRDEITESLLLLEKYNINADIHTIICNRNNTKKDLESIYTFVRKLSNVTKWKVDIADLSLYKSNNESFMIDNVSIDLLDYGKQIKDNNNNFRFIFNNTSTKRKRYKSVKNYYTSKSLCSANVFGMVILPDGNVTICEELYWHPHFLIGNIHENNIEEIWNSEKALNLFNSSQDDCREQSACSTCTSFDECRIPKQVCYKEVLKDYGYENWDYAPQECPRSVAQL